MDNRKTDQLVQFIARRDYLGAVAYISIMLKNETGTDWNKYLPWLQEFLLSGVPRFTVWMPKGNDKQKFLSWSSLAGIPFCAGAGACLNFCFTRKAMRYPAALCRMIQNTVLLQSAKGRAVILSELDKHEKRARKHMAKKGAPLDCRLYVDGDFSNLSELIFWMDAIAARPWLQVYGYSKSFLQFLEYEGRGFQWPNNYLVNLSEGHCHSMETAQAFAGLPCVRGPFESIDLGRKVKQAEQGTRALTQELRAAWQAKKGTAQKPFVCRGKCYDCTPNGHACGLESFRGIPVIIAQH